MAGIPGPGPDDSTSQLIHRYGVNGFILFKRNCHSPEQIRGLTNWLKEECAQAGLLPPLIAIDQEGGSVARLGPPFTTFAAARYLAESTEPEAALTEYATTCARELNEVGINLNFAPVLDISPNGKGLFMEERSLGGDPEIVARLGSIVIKKMQEQGLAACGKHFQGLGRAVPDPHITLPTIAASAGELEEDLIPFAEAVRTGVAMIMTSHTLYPALDPDNQATFSPRVLTDILRVRLGFAGIIVTDDLEMGAVENDCDTAEATTAALLAGADLLLVCHDHAKVTRSIKAIAEGRTEDARLSRRVGESLVRLENRKKI